MPQRSHLHKEHSNTTAHKEPSGIKEIIMYLRLLVRFSQIFYCVAAPVSWRDMRGKEKLCVCVSMCVSVCV